MIGCMVTCPTDRGTGDRLPWLHVQQTDAQVIGCMVTCPTDRGTGDRLHGYMSNRQRHR